MLCMILCVVLLVQLSGMLLTSLMQQSLSPLDHLGHFHALLVQFWSFQAPRTMRVGCLWHYHHFHDNVTTWASLVHFCSRVAVPVLAQGHQGASPGSQRHCHLSMVTPFIRTVSSDPGGNTL